MKRCLLPWKSYLFDSEAQGPFTISQNSKISKICHTLSVRFWNFRSFGLVWNFGNCWNVCNFLKLENCKTIAICLGIPFLNRMRKCAASTRFHKIPKHPQSATLSPFGFGFWESLDLGHDDGPGKAQATKMSFLLTHSTNIVLPSGRSSVSVEYGPLDGPDQASAKRWGSQKTACRRVRHNYSKL